MKAPVRTPLIVAAAVIGLFGTAGCTDPFDPAPDDVHAFVESEGLPQIRRIETLFDLRSQDVLIFQVTFGPPRDCPSGCFYDRALGMRHAGAIGWLDVAGEPMQYDSARRTYFADRSSRRYFPVSAAHAGLFAPALLDRLAGDASLYMSYAGYLAAHDSTPEFGLLRLAERLPEGWTHVAVLIATHPNARCSRAVQERVMSTPGEPFSGARDLAAEVLASMPQRCG